jgi:hypothetical protein
MGECSTGSSISINERVDGLKLRMRNCRLGDWGKIVGATKCAQVDEELFDEFGWRWNELSATWVIGTSPNPILLASDLASELLESSSSKKPTVHFKQNIQGDRIVFRHTFDSENHRINVVEHLCCGDI